MSTYNIRQALTGEYSVHGEPSSADCLLGLAFGYVKVEGKIMPGRSNQQLANFIAKFFPDLPKILSTELLQAYSKNHKSDSNVLQIEKARQPNQRLDTLEFLLQAQEIMKNHGWHTALLVAHPYHLPWVDYLCKQHKIQTVVPDGLQGVGFDIQSEQYWTRDIEAWQKEVTKRHLEDSP